MTGPPLPADASTWTPVQHLAAALDPAHSLTARMIMARGFLNRHAHQLAEQQRAWLTQYIDDTGTIPTHQDDINQMINHIDPTSRT